MSDVDRRGSKLNVGYVNQDTCTNIWDQEASCTGRDGTSWIVERNKRLKFPTAKNREWWSISSVAQSFRAEVVEEL
jgi:hypothetical protein